MSEETQPPEVDEDVMERRVRIVGAVVLTFALLVILASAYTAKVNQVNQLPVAPPPNPAFAPPAAP